MAAQQGNGGQGSGSASGLMRDPRALAAGAAGLGSAIAALWAFRGLPLGGVTLWLSPLPLFLAGLGFGPVALGAALAVAALALLLLGTGLLPLVVFFLGIGLPAALLVGASGAARGRIGLRWPLALLGLYPAAVVLAAAFALADMPGGLEGTLRRAVEIGLSRMGLPAAEAVVADLARVKAAAIGFWVSVALAVNGSAAQSVLTRLGLASAPTPRWSDEARLPNWYPALPALAALAWLLSSGDTGYEAGLDAAEVAGGSGDAVTLSVMLCLMLPVLLQGLAAAHRLSRSFARGRTTLLVLLYAFLLLFSVPTALLVTALGLYDNWGPRRGTAPPPPPAPPHS